MECKSQPLYQHSSSDSSQDSLLEKDEYHGFVRPRKTFWSQERMIVLHGFLIIIYSMICFVVVQNANHQINNINSNLIESPARSAVKNVQTVFQMNGNAIETYFGDPPTPEIDQRWLDLSRVSTFRFSQEQMTRWDRIDEGVRLSDDSGYMGTLNVFHEMHCLKRIYMFIHKDRYYGSMNLTEYEQTMNMRHTMHCLEALRQGVQCRADISPVTYRFKPDWKIPMANWTSPHECKNWDAILGWAKENSLDPYTPGLVIHPTLGPAYEGEFDVARKLGIEIDKSHH